MTSNPRSREAAYADLVAGLIDARVDVASDRFDAELEAAEAAGRLDPATARLLRWWQRESVRAVTEHARSTIPTTLVALERANAEARDAVHRADAAWTTARGVTARATYSAPEPVVAPPAEPPPAPPAAAAPAAPAAAPAPAAETPAPSAPAYAPPPWSDPAAPEYPEPAATLQYRAAHEAPADAPAPPAPPVAAPAPAPAASPAPAYAASPDDVPAIVDLTDDPPGGDDPATPGTGRRRTLLAGLTVLPRSDD